MKLLQHLIIIAVLHASSLQAQINWNQPLNIGPPSSGNNHPRIVVDGSGIPLVVWYHASHVMFSRFNGSSFDPPCIISPLTMTAAGASWMGPDIAAKGDTVFVVFKETPEHIGHVWSMFSFNGGMSFSDPFRVDYLGENLARFPTVTIDASGNPIVAFMKFNSEFLEAQWAVSKSSDFGVTFSPDVLASGWSSQGSEVCDCCPGALVSSDNTVAMLYRDNKNNIRDSWAGISVDGGETFAEGINVDGHNWMINACPSSGPDAVILNDSMFTTYMSGAGGKSLVYINSIPLNDIESSLGKLVVPDHGSISQQNFPRISGYGDALGVIWKQVVNGNDELVIRFTNDIANGLPENYDTIHLNNIMNADIAIHDGNVYVVWEDILSGTVKFRSGTYTQTTSVAQGSKAQEISIYPNPAIGSWMISGEDLGAVNKMDLLDVRGNLVYSKDLGAMSGQILEIENSSIPSGVYFLRLISGERIFTYKVVRGGD